MAKGRKTGGRDFQAGNNANPRGRPRLPKNLREARRLSAEKLLKAFITAADMDRGALKQTVEDPNTPMATLIGARLIMNAAGKGDTASINTLLNHVIGKRSNDAEPEREPIPPIIMEDADCDDCPRIKALEKRIAGLMEDKPMPQDLAEEAGEPEA